MKASKIALLAAGTIALATAGYFTNEWRACSGLEADYLEEATAIGTNLQSGDAMRGLVEEELLGNRVAASMETANRTYWQIRSRCGDEKALSVQQKGLDLIEGIRRKPA